jgi:hypothetical protein
VSLQVVRFELCPKTNYRASLDWCWLLFCLRCDQLEDSCMSSHSYFSMHLTSSTPPLLSPAHPSNCSRVHCSRGSLFRPRVSKASCFQFGLFLPWLMHRLFFSRWLVANGKSDKALRVLTQVHWDKKDPDSILACREHYQIEQQFRLDSEHP